MPLVPPPVPTQSRETAETVVLERKPLKEILLSAYGVALILLTLLTLGFLLFIVLLTYYRFTPKRIWIKNGRLYSDRTLPESGVELSSIRLQLIRQTLLFVTINQCLKIYFRNERGREKFLGVNRLYHRKSEFDSAVKLLAGAAA